MDRGVIGRFREVVKTVLSTRDPSLDLEPNQRFAAPIYGKTHPYSAQLRSGLVGSLIQFALTDQHGAGTSGQAIADAVVRDLLSGEGSTVKDAWQSLAAWLPDLAEAAPNAFISSVQTFRADREAVAALFTGADFFGPNPHVYLLWALERLAWSKEFFTAAVWELLELAAIDQGGKLSNRPDRSLIEVFRPWHPQTSADVSHRLDALDVLYARQPDVLWPVAVALLPTDHGVASPTASPEWRRWKPDEIEAPPTAGYSRFVEGLVRKMISWAREKPERWKDLIRHYLHLHASHAELAKELLAALQETDPNELPTETRATLTSTLREILSWHEEFDDENPGPDDTRLKPLYELRNRFEPENPLSKYTWLFVGWPRLSRGKKVKYDDQERELREARLGGLKAIFAAYGVDGLFKLSELSDRPDLVGSVSAGLNLVPDDEAVLLSGTLAIEPTKERLDPRLRLGIGYVSGAVWREGTSWIGRAEKLPGITWSANMRVNLAWGLPSNGATWDQVESWGREVSELYWWRVPVDFIRDPKDVERAVRSLLGANRPYRAIYIADQRHVTDQAQSSDAGRLPAELIRTVLAEAPRHYPDAEWFSPGLKMLGYHVERLLAELETSTDDAASVAALEWAWMPVLEHSERGLKALQRAISSDPVLFVDLLRAAYRGEGEPEREVTKEEESRARQAYKLLESWRRVPGSIDSPAGAKPGESAKVEGDIRFDAGQINEDKLRDWVAKARELAKQSGHLKQCDVQFGEVLAYAPHDETEVWPCVEVRNLIERLASEHVERGIRRGVHVRRGAHFRSPGGAQERVLAAKFRGFADKVSPKWPRTGELFFLALPAITTPRRSGKTTGPSLKNSSSSASSF